MAGLGAPEESRLVDKTSISVESNAPKSTGQRFLDGDDFSGHAVLKEESVAVNEVIRKCLNEFLVDKYKTQV